jgi:predicted molibdopterin-dependent oxidoreductase YjgC
LKASVAGLSPEDTEAKAGVAAEALRRAAQIYLGARQAAILCSTGLALSPTGPAAIQALSELAALCSPPKGPSAVVLSLLSRNNLQGCRDMGVAPDTLPGYGELSDEAAAQRLERAWQGKMCREAGLSAWQMLGRVKAMYVMGDDPIRSLPEPERTRAALGELEFLVVQDIFLSPLATAADVVLPAAALPERDGTCTNLERRVQRIRQAALPPGEAREDWRIVADVSEAMGKPFRYQGAREIFEEIAEVVPIYTGVLYPPLEVNGGIRLPAAARGAGQSPAAPERTETRRQLPQGEETLVAGVATSDEYPLLLVADPSLRPWDGEVTVSQTLTMAIEFQVIETDYPGGMLCLNPEDARRFEVRGGRNARVASAKGERQMRVRVTDDVPEGIAILPYGQAAASGLMEISANSETDRPILMPTPISIAPGQ